jgi:pyruvate kinase
MLHSRAQIIATLGPATKELAIIKKLIKHQMDAARLNFAWGTYKEHGLYIKNVRQAAQELGRRIPIIQDLAGPRIQKTKGHHFNPVSKQIITKKDLRDLAFGLEQQVDYIALSYVGTASDIILLKNEIKKLNSQVPVIAKVERRIALENLDEIVKASDALMIARGDLGNEVPLEKIPFLQRMIIKKTKQAQKPVITATQMLLSMTQKPSPTRAEVSDVAHAILDGSDALMLSEETAIGKYPLKAVLMMEKIILEAEKHGEKTLLNLL